MDGFLRIISFVAFVSLLLYVVLFLLFQQGGSPLALAFVVLAGFTSPVAVLALIRARYRRAFEELGAAGRHLASMHAIGQLHEGTERIAPELVKALALISVELRRRERAFDEHRSATHQILDGIGEGVLAIDLDRRVRVANKRASELFQFEEGVEGRHYIEVIRSSQLVRAFDQALRGETSNAQASFTVRGEVRQIEMRVFPLQSGDVVAVALFIDVTQIEKLQAVRREFMADFHHEVRTPLAGLHLAIDNLERGAVNESQREQLFKILGRQVSRLERLMQEVGQLTEIESGELILHLEPTEMKGLLQDVADDWSKVATERGIAIQVEGIESTVQVDGTKIEQVLSNLVDNAIRHSGTDAVILAVSEEEGWTVVSVTDRGDGIDPEDQEKIFHRFYRVDKSRSRESEGTGLGLAIAKHLMRRHRGTISVSSERGRGARFELRFPR